MNQTLNFSASLPHYGIFPIQIEDKESINGILKPNSGPQSWSLI